MNLREWIANNIGYRFGGCFYTKHHNHIFNFIKSKIPNNFYGKSISDLGCGDGSNTVKLKEIFKAKNITGYDQHKALLQKAEANGIKIVKLNLNKQIPKGEMATFTFSLHHLKDKKKALLEVKNSFRYIFLCEPINDLYHRLLDAGNPLSKTKWIKLFDEVLGTYKLHQYKNNLILFYENA